MRTNKTTQREKDITRVSVVGIVSNAILGGVKIAAGIISGSVAIISDAVNNLTDTSSSIITIVGTHLATRHPDSKHPFGYGRVEYLTSLVIGLLVLFTGFELCHSSINAIIHHEHVHYSYWSAIILAITVAVKIFLGRYTYNAGKHLESDALMASGLDAKSDSVATGAALFSTILFLWKKIDIDAWVGVLISLYIVRTGFIILRDVVSKIVGEAPSKDLANKIHQLVRTIPIVKGDYDLMLNSYGPDFYVGSIDIEVNHDITAEQICREVHPIQAKLYHELRVILAFGIYAVDKSSPDTLKAAAVVKDFCDSNDHCKAFHGLFIDQKTHNVYCDIVVDFGHHHDGLAPILAQKLSEALPGYSPIITVDEPSE